MRLNPKETEEVRLSRDELYDLVWSTPLSRLAHDFDVSDVALAKWCKKLNVPRPGVGYWAKVQAGHRVTKRKLPKATKDLPTAIYINRIVHPSDAQPPCEPTFQPVEVHESLPDRPHDLIRFTRRALSKAKVEQGTTTMAALACSSAESPSSALSAFSKRCSEPPRRWAGLFTRVRVQRSRSMASGCRSTSRSCEARARSVTPLVIARTTTSTCRTAGSNSTWAEMSRWSPAFGTPGRTGRSSVWRTCCTRFASASGAALRASGLGGNGEQRGNASGQSGSARGRLSESASSLKNAVSGTSTFGSRFGLGQGASAS